MITRTRSITDILDAGVQTVRHFNPSTGALIETQTTSSPSASYSTQVESIASERPRHKYDGECVHTKTVVRYLNAQPVNVYTQDRRYEYTYTGGYLARTFLWPRSSYLTAGVLVDQVDWSQLSFRALEAMQPSLNENDQLLAAFVRDLPNPKSMLQQWRRWRAEWQRDGWRRFLEWRWNQVRNNPGKLHKRAAALNLWWQFQMRPFVDDVKTIFSSLSTLEARIEGMLREAGKSRVAHHSQTLDIVHFPHEGEKEVWRDSGQYHTLTAKYGWISRPKYHATLTYKLDATELQGILGQVRGFISAMGLDRFLGTLWEFAPYSFAVDWFIDVQGFLKSLDRRLFGALPIIIQSYCDSVKYEYRTTVNYVAMFWTTPLCRVAVGTSNVKRYERRRSIPATVDLQSANGLTLNRIGLAASLFALKSGR